MVYKIALCQMRGAADAEAEPDRNKKETMAVAEAMVREAVTNGAQLVALPEMWNCPYSNLYFRDYAEEESGKTVEAMARLASELGIYLVGGSIPELFEGKVYNTCFIFDRRGAIIGKHRKVHLFDVDVKGRISFMESETLSPGNHATVVDTEFGKVGVAICYDVRFPELMRKMTLEGARLIVLPAAFNTTTGPAHWDLTMRARALDNQVYFAAVSPARDLSGPYQAYGSSCVTTPWGEFMTKADEKETILYAEIDTEYQDEIRQQLPLLKHRRPELY